MLPEDHPKHFHFFLVRDGVWEARAAICVELFRQPFPPLKKKRGHLIWRDKLACGNFHAAFRQEALKKQLADARFCSTRFLNICHPSKTMQLTHQKQNRPPCPLERLPQSERSRLVRRLFQKTTEAAKKNKDDFACDMQAREPFSGPEARRGGITLMPYINGFHLYLGCSNTSCPNRAPNFFLGKCRLESAHGDLPSELLRVAKAKPKR